MPYNTRRKSISLVALGVQVPGATKDVSRTPRAPRSPPSTTTTPQQPPTKRIKRSHTLTSVSTSSSSPPATTNSTTRHDRQRGNVRGRLNTEITPPPSPGEPGSSRLDTEGINDDVVVAVLQQIERTGNRPHHGKELAELLTNQLTVVESSANPQAIISSRLTTYMRRPWTALAPCPLGKELIGTHPRRTYFFLTNSPHQPIVEPSFVPAAATKSRLLSPSLSSASIAEDEDGDHASGNHHARTALSPSPELDLSAPELEADSGSSSLHHHPEVTFSHRSSFSHDGSHRGSHPPTPANIAHNRRAQSPPLERDEKEFTATASSIQQRSRSLEFEKRGTVEGTGNANQDVTEPDPEMEDLKMGGVHDDDSEGTIAMDLDHHEDANALFGHGDGLHLAPAPMLNEFSSPIITPLHSLHISTPVTGVTSLGTATGTTQLSLRRKYGLDDSDSMQDVRIVMTDDTAEAGVGFGGSWNTWDDLKSPEMVDLSELDDLFDRY